MGGRHLAASQAAPYSATDAERARAATSSAQTPGSYGLHDGKADGKAFSFTLPKANPAVPAPSVAKGLKVPGFLKPPMVPGLVLNLIGALQPLNLTQLAGNITTQCAPTLPQRSLPSGPLAPCKPAAPKSPLT